MDKFTDYLKSINACADAVQWAEGKTWPEVFDTCHRGDWLLWLFNKTANKTDENLRLLTRAKAQCALTVRRLMKPVSINACEVALRFADGEATRDELAYAAYAAYAAAAAADAADAARTKNQKETADICRQSLPIKVWSNLNLQEVQNGN